MLIAIFIPCALLDILGQKIRLSITIDNVVGYLLIGCGTILLGFIGFVLVDFFLEDQVVIYNYTINYSVYLSIIIVIDLILLAKMAIGGWFLLSKTMSAEEYDGICKDFYLFRFAFFVFITVVMNLFVLSEELQYIVDSLNIVFTIYVAYDLLEGKWKSFYWDNEKTPDLIAINNTKCGDVLSNENYNVPFYKMINDYYSYKTEQDLRKYLFSSKMNSFSKTSLTCLEYETQLQGMIDNLFWFAYLDNGSEDYKTNCNLLIQKIFESGNKQISMMDSDNKVIFEEHLNLIKYVLEYQFVEGTTTNWEYKDILQIRSDVFGNKTTKGIYFYYLGLMYYNEAVILIKKLSKIDPKTDVFLPKSLNVLLCESHFTKKARNQMVFYLNEAVKAFESAEAVIDEENLWLGSISHNLARAELLRLFVIKKSAFSNSDWKTIRELFKKAIRISDSHIMLFAKENFKQASYPELELYGKAWLTKSLYYMLKKYFNPRRTISLEKAKEISQMRYLIKQKPDLERSFESTLAYIDNTIGYSAAMQ